MSNSDAALPVTGRWLTHSDFTINFVQNTVPTDLQIIFTSRG